MSNEEQERFAGEAPTGESSEVARLEALLYEASKALRAAEAENGRRERLVRDMAEQIRAMGARGGTDASVAQAPVVAPNDDTLRAEITGLRYRLRDRELSLAAFRVAGADLAQAVARAAALDEAVTALRRRTNELNIRCVESEERAGRASARAESLAAAARAHDAIVDRLRKSVHDGEERVLALTQEMGRLRDERDRLRNVVSAATDQDAELEAQRSRVPQLEARLRAATERANVAVRERDSAVRAMEETKGILESLRAELGAGKAGLAERVAARMTHADADEDENK